MTDPEDEESQAHDDTWHGLDEAQLRLLIRKTVGDIRDHELDSHSRLVRQLVRVRQIVQEELATAFQRDFNFSLEYQGTSDRAACERLAESTNQDLADLGLAVSGGAAGFHAQLGVALTPPAPSQSWLQLEGIGAASGRTPRRLPSPLLEKLTLVPEPSRPATAPNRGERSR